MPGSNAIVPGFYQWLKLTQESTYGVYNAAGASTWVRITGDTGFTMSKNALRTVIRSADAQNRRLSNVSAKYALAGSLQTPLYPGQAQFWLDAACKLDANYKLASFTADYFDGQTPRRNTGLMVNSLALTSNSDQQYASLDVSFIGSQVIDGITLAAPDPSTAFPDQHVWPYLHSELAGKFTKAGTAVPYFSDLSVSVENILVAKHYEAQYVGWVAWCGRNVNMTSKLAYINTDWRDLYESQAPQTLQATFYRDATTNLLLDFKTFSIVGSRTPSRSLSDVMEESFGIEAFYDQSNSTDFGYTSTYPSS